jgi:hypothetical protein
MRGGVVIAPAGRRPAFRRIRCSARLSGKHAVE